jgi:NADH dehydrogenase/NADH:ubiquinone oxidoreductase subunit G
VGIDIPTLCWYPKLPIVGNAGSAWFRSGSNKLLPACATPAADGMVVETESKSAVDSRRGVLDFLLERYPGEHLPQRRSSRIERRQRIHR